MAAIITVAVIGVFGSHQPDPGGMVYIVGVMLIWTFIPLIGFVVKNWGKDDEERRDKKWQCN